MGALAGTPHGRIGGRVAGSGGDLVVVGSIHNKAGTGEQPATGVELSAQNRIKTASTRHRLQPLCLIA
ncbi:hypothetical protein NDU88_005339 [Pleurodeles waltl]|uniref:Uncharacterized protein n=1 Tax=Pleurodeles waltl TaxID=8319 RepID=A0AAV7LMD7_PLEWA|nr:hypothetical protein NDU88_005339 [Pleurodeles waltl]